MQKKLLNFIKLTKNNYEDVLFIKHKLFPESNSDDDYVKYFNQLVKSNYYLVKINKTIVATIGWYDFDNQNKEAFVGWFGVLPEFQKQGIGKESLNFIINEVKLLNYDYLRVYTDKKVNYESTLLYDKVFDLKENYTYPDKLGKTNNFVVYSKFLKDYKNPWNNRPLNEDDNYDF